MDDTYTNSIVGCKYKLLNKIGMGAFGQVYLGNFLFRRGYDFSSSIRNQNSIIMKGTNK